MRNQSLCSYHPSRRYCKSSFGWANLVVPVSISVFYAPFGAFKSVLHVRSQFVVYLRVFWSLKLALCAFSGLGCSPRRGRASRTSRRRRPSRRSSRSAVASWSLLWCSVESYSQHNQESHGWLTQPSNTFDPHTNRCESYKPLLTR